MCHLYKQWILSLSLVVSVCTYTVAHEYFCFPLIALRLNIYFTFSFLQNVVVLLWGHNDFYAWKHITYVCTLFMLQCRWACVNFCNFSLTVWLFYCFTQGLVINPNWLLQVNQYFILFIFDFKLIGMDFLFSVNVLMLKKVHTAHRRRRYFSLLIREAVLAAIFRNSEIAIYLSLDFFWASLSSFEK